MKLLQTICAGAALSLATFAPMTWADDAGTPEVIKTQTPAKEIRPRIQIAILLDTSGSMQGLIDQTKTQLWKIVNELALTKRDGKRPELQVALYEYGKSSVPAADGFVRQIVPLSTDLDKISEELFKLTTNGGEEYCGRAIRTAVDQLNWSTNNRDFKAIFIAGNEAFTQGEVDYHKSCAAAIAKGILVNTIHCGAADETEMNDWREGARLADGKFINIDHNQEVVQIQTPHDAEIAKLGGELNKTYVAFGKNGAEKKSRQLAADSNAVASAKPAAAPAAAAERAVAKAGAGYKADDWDLVDASKESLKKLEELDAKDLPAEMKNMSADERKDYIKGKQKERGELQEKITKLNEERRKYIAEETKKQNVDADKTVDGAIIKAIREQCVKKDFKFE